MRGRSVLAVNSGSSSIKFALFTFGAEPSALKRGELAADARPRAVPELMSRLSDDLEHYPLAGIGHRIVHGGPTYFEPSLITPDLMRALESLVPFAPNHLPDEIDLIQALQLARRDVPQFACFDTGFHHDLPDVAQRLPVPDDDRRCGRPSLRLSRSLVRVPDTRAGTSCRRGRCTRTGRPRASGQRLEPRRPA